MREKLQRTILSLLVAAGAVLGVRWTIRTAMARAYRADRELAPSPVPVVPAARIYSLSALVPEDLRANVAGLPVRRRAERLGMPYDLAVDVADEMAASAGWERVDDENALTIQNLSGMERIYKTPEGSIVLREVRPIVGDDSLMKDFVFPAELIPEPNEQTTPDELARRSARHVKDLMPDAIRDVVAGSPLMTQLIERGEGAALIVHCVAETSAEDTKTAIEMAAIGSGWSRDPSAALPGMPAEALGGGPGEAPGRVEGWTKGNLKLYFETVPRAEGGCDVNYRFADDEVYIPRKEQKT